MAREGAKGKTFFWGGGLGMELCEGTIRELNNPRN